MIIMALIFSGTFSQQVYAKENVFSSRNLFYPTNTPILSPINENTISSRSVLINSNILVNKNNKCINPKIFTLNLFSNVKYKAIVIKLEKTYLGCVWTGRIGGIGYSYFTIMKVGNLFIGNIGSPQGVYEFSHVRGRIYRIIKINQGLHQD